MDGFERLAEREKPALERYVRFRIGTWADAEDVIQETLAAAFCAFPQLKNKDAFKPWLISIARNKCNDYYRSKQKCWNGLSLK